MNRPTSVYQIPCHIHGDDPACDCKAYAVAMGANDALLEAELEQPGFSALESLDWRSIVRAAGERE